MGKKVLIVGGVAGGASAAARLRRLDENAEIILFERGEYISYANCGLPYHVGGAGSISMFASVRRLSPSTARPGWSRLKTAPRASVIRKAMTR